MARKMYAKLSDYGNLVIPMSLLEKIVSEGYMVDTRYEESVEVISAIRDINRFEVVQSADIDAALAQRELEK